MTEELKKLISDGQKARYKRIKAAQSELDEPVLKRCTKCGEWKNRKIGFPQRKRKIQSGVSIYPAGECCDCSKKRAAKNRARLREEGKLAEKQREWDSHRDREHQARYNREYQRIQRVLEGVKPRGPWKRYKHEAISGPDPMVLRSPLDNFLAELPMTPTELSVLTGFDEAVFRRSKNKWVAFSTVDRIFTALGIPDQVAVLWPLDDPSVRLNRLAV